VSARGFLEEVRVMKKITSLYKNLGIIICFCSVGVSVLCFEIVKINPYNPFLHQTVVSILFPMVCFYRFAFGKKRGHPIIFSYILISLIISMETYGAITGAMPLNMEFLIGMLIVFIVIMLSRILRKYKDSDYFRELDIL